MLQTKTMNFKKLLGSEVFKNHSCTIVCPSAPPCCVIYTFFRVLSSYFKVSGDNSHCLKFGKFHNTAPLSAKRIDFQKRLDWLENPEELELLLDRLFAK